LKRRLFQHRRQAFSRSREPRHDGTDRNAYDLGDFFLRKALDLTQDQDLASIVNGVGDSSEENGANDKSFAPRT